MGLIIDDNRTKQAVEEFFEKLEKLYPEHQVFALDAIDGHLREKMSQLCNLTKCDSPAVFLGAYGYKMISGDEVKKIRGTVKYLPGEEPSVIKGKVNSVINRLKEYYPDGIIDKGIQSNHKKLSSNISGLYQWLGYENSAEMLKAYGFQVQYCAEGGRPADDYEALIKTLQEKYSNGKKPRTMSELIKDNPDLTSRIKTLQNTSNKLFGMTLKKYFAKIGILEGAYKSTPKLTCICHEILVDGQEAPILCTPGQGKQPIEGWRTEICYSDGHTAIGTIVKTRININLNDLSLNKKDIPKISRRISKMDYFTAEIQGIDEPIFSLNWRSSVNKGDCVKMLAPSDRSEVTGRVIETGFSVWEDKLPIPIEEMYRCVQNLTKETAKGRPRKTHTVCKIRPQHHLNTLYYYSPFDEIKVGDIVKIPLRWSGFTSGEVISVEKTTDSLKCYDKIPIKKLQKIIEIDKADKTAIMDRTMILAQQLGTEEWSVKPVNNMSEQYNAMTYFSSAIFRGLDNDVQKALLSIYSAYADPMKYKVEIVEGISQFECSNSLVPMVVEKFPNLKAIFFAEDWGDGSVYLAYSESGYDTVTSLRYIGKCDFYARDRWTLIHDPSEESFVCGDVTYHFEEKELWEKCDYVLPSGNERLLGGIKVPSIPYHKEKSNSPCDTIHIYFSEDDFAKRIKLIESKSLELFVDEILKNEWPISLPSGLKIHCSGSQNLNTTANTVKALLEKNIDELIEKVASSLGEGNYLDYSPSSFPYKIINKDIIFSLEISSFEEFGKNVRLHDELFSIGDVIANTLSDLTSKYGKLPNATYEGIISWTQIWAEEYNSSVLLCNTERNEYAKELILNDDDFWNDYEFLMNF